MLLQGDGAKIYCHDNLYLYVMHGKRMTSTEFSKTLSKLTEEYIGVGLSSLLSLLTQAGKEARQLLLKLEKLYQPHEAAFPAVRLQGFEIN